MNKAGEAGSRMPMRAALVLVVCGLLAACNGDPNARPIYGKDSGLPVNCRAYVQTVIDGYRSKRYDADDSFSALERNCGMNGQIWGLTQ